MDIRKGFASTAFALSVLTLGGCGSDVFPSSSSSGATIPTIGCLGDIQNAVVDEFRPDRLTLKMYEARETLPENLVLSIHLVPSYSELDVVSSRGDVGGSTWRWRWFAQAQAASCPSRLLPESLVSAQVVSDADLSEEYPAGASLNHLVVGGLEAVGHQISAEGYTWLLSFDSIPDELQHNFSITLELDSGATHTVMVGPVGFPASFAAPVEPPSPLPEPGAVTSRLNDTGVTRCSDGDNQSDCPLAGYPLQDGDLGRDALARDGALDKVGGGAAGFDFTKLDASGQPLPASAESWSCVHDNHTGLVWEVKTPNGLRASTSTYSWYNPIDSENGGEPGTVDGGQCSGSSCDTLGYQQALNAAALCGLSDWRLPGRTELQSLLHYGRSGNQEPKIDASYFPHTVDNYYWTREPGARENAVGWAINFLDGRDAAGWHRESTAFIRLVSGGESASVAGVALASESQHCLRNLLASTPVSQFEFLADGAVVRHLPTNLEWQRCSVGQTWDGAQCQGSVQSYSWPQALHRVLDEPGWRLPSIKELASIVETCRERPAVNPEVFPQTPFLSGELEFEFQLFEFLPYWSSTPASWNVLVVRPETGLIGRAGSTMASGVIPNYHDLGRVRLVRDGPLDVQ